MGSDEEEVEYLPALEPASLDEDLDFAARETLRPTALWLGILCGLFTAADLILLPPGIAVPLAAGAAASAGVLLVVRRILRGRTVTHAWLHPAGAMMVFLALANTFAALWVSRDIRHSTSVTLVLVVATFTIVSSPWFAAVAAVALAGPVALIIVIQPGGQSEYFILGVVMAAVLSTAGHVVFRGTVRRLKKSQATPASMPELNDNPSIDSQDFLCVVELDGSLRAVNPALRSFLGRPVAELLARPFGDFIDPRDRDEMAARMKSLAKGAATVTFESRLQAPGGESRWVLWTAGRLPAGDAFYVSGRDITIRKRMEEQLRLSLTAMESAAVGITITRRDGTITWVNSAFTRLSGYPAGEVIGLDPRFLDSGTHPREFFDQMRQAINDGLVWRGEVVNRRKDGVIYVEEQTISPVRDDTGEISHFVAIRQDVTERKVAEKAIRENEERMRQEIGLAAEVQQSLLPRTLPVLEGYEVAAMARPARFISGDLYDWVMTDPDSCFFAMADIAGKGVSAAMMTSVARTLLRSESVSAPGPAALLSRLNELLCDELTQAGLFITFFAVRLQASLGRLTWANAGHTEGILIRGPEARFDTLPATGLPVGVLQDAQVSESVLYIRPGDTLVLYSDGVTEASTKDDELFGTERLRAVLVDNRNETPSAMVHAIEKAVDQFSGGAASADDLTVTAIRAIPRCVPFSYPATLDSLEEACALISGLTRPYGEKFSYETELVASELLTNVIRHAYRGGPGELRGRVSLQPLEVVLDFWDDGEIFEMPRAAQLDPSQPREGGYGLAIIQQLSSHLIFEPATSLGNHWQVRRTIVKDEP